MGKIVFKYKMAQLTRILKFKKFYKIGIATTNEALN
jgi:hypothetical protein